MASRTVCEDCKHASDIKGVLICKRYPLVFVGKTVRNESIWQQPTVGPLDTCGEHESKD
jgi:hypothetical protein